MSRWVLSLLIVAAAAGCVRREGRNTECAWPQESASPLDLSVPAHWRHLTTDVQFAEELAIEYGDAERGRKTVEERGRMVEQCTERLLAWVAAQHSVTAADVERARGHRELRVDIIAVFLPLGWIFCIVSYLVAGRVRRRFGAKERGPWLITSLLASGAIAGAFVMLGELWSWIVEMVRVGNGHLSYRTFRLPWRQYATEELLAGVALFWLITWLTVRRTEPRSALRSADPS